MAGFFSMLASLFFRENWAELHMLYVGSCAIAALLSFLGNETVYFYNVAYDKDYSAFSPGFFLFHHAVKRAIVQKKSQADFLRGGEKYKYFFGAQDSKIYNLKLKVPADKK